MTTDIPGYRAGKWTIDPQHSEVAFTVRHLMMTKVRGRFNRFTGSITTAPDPLDSEVTAEIDLTSIDTNNPQRDADLRSPTFFESDKFPVMTYRSTSLEPGWVLNGELTLKGVTLPVPLQLELNGFGTGRFGDTRAAFTATGELSRKAFGVSFEVPLEGGGVVVGDKIALSLEIQAILEG